MLSWRDAAVTDVLNGGPAWKGLCLKRIRTLLGVPCGAPSAIEAWNAVKHSDRHTGPAPAGTPIFWRIGKYGHVALSDGHPWCFSTDIKRTGHLDRVHVSRIHDQWGAELLGWSATLNGKRLWNPK